KLRRLLDGNISRVCPTENPIGELSSAAKKTRKIRPVGHQTSRSHKFTNGIHRGKSMVECPTIDLNPICECQRVTDYEQRLRLGFDSILRPVALPAGLARLAARPLPTGSVASAKTIGIVAVVCFAASAGPVAQVTITSTFALANSAAISTARSFRPSA